MGEAAAAATEDAESIYWNPAALTRAHRRSVTLTHVSANGPDSVEHAAFSANLGHSNALGAGVLYRSAGRLAHTDEAGLERGGFTPSDMAVTLGAAHDLDELTAVPFLSALSLGIAVKYVESRILASARTWAVDMGTLSPPLLDGRLRLAAVLKNLGGEIKYETNPEPLPLEGRLGAALRLSGSWLFSTDAIFSRDSDPVAGLGGEYLLRLGRAQSIAARAGFNSRAIGDVEGLTGISFGAGWSYGKLGVDYGALPFGSLGLSHRFTLRAEF